MDAFIEILAALLFWRLILSIGVSGALALLSSQVFIGFTAGYCLTLVLIGVAFGIIWQSKPVAFLGFLLIGFVWGGLASWLLGSQIFGALALIFSVGAAGLWYRFLRRRPAFASYLIFSCISLKFGFGLLLLFKAFMLSVVESKLTTF